MKSQTATSKKKILVVEDESVIRDLVCRFLTKEGFDPISAENGLDAQQKLNLHRFDAVVSDINMPGSRLSGLDLLEYTKQNFSIPVLLMTGFSSIANAKEAHALGADAFIAKPFKQQELLKALNDSLGLSGGTTPPNNEQDEKKDSDENYCKLTIGEFISGRTIKQSIFVRLGPDKYVKVAHQGEDLPAEQIKSYISKGIQYLYLTKEDFNKYISSSLVIAQAACNSRSISREKKLNVVKHTGEVILENLHHHPVNAQRYDEAKTLIETTVEFLASSQDSMDLLSSLNHCSDSLYAHSVGVSFYSVLIARELDCTSSLTHIKIAMAGLLHDIGFKEIDPALLDKPRATLTPEEIKIIESHPIRGAQILSGVPKVPAEILQIVMQHHERDRGLGYPLGLERSRIHPFAKIVAVADEFCELAIQKKGLPPIPPMEAFKQIAALYSGLLDPGALAALGKILSTGETTKRAHYTSIAS